MTGSFNFWDTEVWSFVITLVLLLAAMMLANALRRNIPFLKRSLLPSSVLGGFIALAVNSAFKAITGSSMFDLTTLEALTYHDPAFLRDEVLPCRRNSAADGLRPGAGTSLQLGRHI